MHKKAWMAVLVLAAAPLMGCSNSREQQRNLVAMNSLKKDVETLRAENTALKAKVTELEGQLAKATQERDELRAANEMLLQQQLTPASGKKRPARR